MKLMKELATSSAIGATVLPSLRELQRMTQKKLRIEG
jgi:hypothetical protein